MKLQVLTPVTIALTCAMAMAPVCAKAEITNRDQVLEAFKQSFRWTESVSLHIQSEGYGNNEPELLVKRDLILLKDGDTRLQSLGDSQHIERSTGKPYRRKDRIWPDGPYQTLYSGPNGLLLQASRASVELDRQLVQAYEDGKERVKIERAHRKNGGPMLGYTFPFTTKQLPEFFALDNTTMREDTLDGQEVVILEAEDPEGHITAWVAPDDGYSLRKCQLVKEAGKHLGYNGKVYYNQNPLFGEPLAAERLLYDIKEIEYEEVDGFRVAIAMECTLTEELEKGKKYELHTAFAVTQIEINPDFESLNAFKFAVPEGSKVFYNLKNKRMISGFEWRDGALVATIDGQDVEDIENTVLALNEGTIPTPAESLDWVALNESGRGVTGFGGHRVLFVFLIGISTVLLLGILGLRRHAARAAKKKN